MFNQINLLHVYNSNYVITISYHIITYIFIPDGTTAPNILTSPGVFQSHVGSTIILPCNISGLGDLVLLWKQGSRIIFAGDIKVRRDERFERGNNTIKKIFE